jgi:hypothetical protein
LTNPQSDRYLNIQELTTGTISSLAFPQINFEVEKLLTAT